MSDKKTAKIRDGLVDEMGLAKGQADGYISYEEVAKMSDEGSIKLMPTSRLWHGLFSTYNDEMWDDMCLPDDVRAEYAKVYPMAAKVEQE